MSMEAQVNGMKIHYREKGAGEPLVLLHGFPLDGSMWEDQLDALSDRFRVIAPDLRGCGGTEASESTSMEQMADDVAALLDHLGVANAIACGFSMGGYVAFALLRRRPELVKGLILTNTKAEPDTAEGKAGRAAMAAAIRERGAIAAAEAMLPKLLSPAALEQRPELAERLRRTMLAQPPQGLAAAVMAMAARPDSTPQLGGIGVPALVIGADGDTIMPPAIAEATANAIPGAELWIIAGAGHAANVEQPAAWNGIVRDWYADAFGG
jgi:pimeloyl-ACP methyl ester carboxylesterase